MSTNNYILKKQMLEALEKSLGIVTRACKHVGIARNTHYQWMRSDEDYAKAVKDIDDIALDMAETALHNQIKEGNTASTIFYLKTKGKNRGYIERIEQENTHRIKDYTSWSDKWINSNSQESKSE